MQKLWYSFLVCWLVSPAFAQIDVAAALDSTHILIGDHLKLHLSVSHTPEVNVLKANLDAMRKAKAIEIIEEGEWDTLKTSPELLIQKDITFTVFDSGAYFIPVIGLNYELNGTTGTKYTNQLLVEVGVPQMDSIYLAPIRPIIEEPLAFEDFAPYLAGLAILGLLFGLGYYYYKKKQAEELPSPPEVIIPAHEIAFKKLDELKAAKLWQQGEIKAYQSQLTFIVREYLENRYDVQALESTTFEILDQLKTIPFSENLKSNLKEMLELADLVKFAKAEPPVEAHDRLMGYAENFVLTTKQKVEIKEEN